jgi:U4/U6.U5 tri-snRNP-associated protein 2
MLQAVVKCSKKRFQITKQGDPVEFLAWLLNSLHLTLNGTKNANSSIIYKAFQGKMKVYTRKIPPIDLVNMIKLLINNKEVLFSSRVKMKKENY